MKPVQSQKKKIINAADYLHWRLVIHEWKPMFSEVQRSTCYCRPFWRVQVHLCSVQQKKLITFGTCGTTSSLSLHLLYSISHCHIDTFLSFIFPACLFNPPLIFTYLHSANTDALKNSIMLILCRKSISLMRWTLIMKDILTDSTKTKLSIIFEYKQQTLMALME